MARFMPAVVILVDTPEELISVPTKTGGPGRLESGLPTGQTAFIGDNFQLYMLLDNNNQTDAIATCDDSDRLWVPITAQYT